MEQHYEIDQKGDLTKGLAVIGSSDFVLGFALAGVKHSIVTRKVELLSTINAHNDASIIIVDDELSMGLTQKQRDSLETSVSPIIILLGKDATKLTERLKKNIKTTLGVDLLKQDIQRSRTESIDRSNNAKNSVSGGS